MTAKEISDLFVELELHLIASLKRNLLRHKRQEEIEGSQNGVPEKWEAWQSAKLRDIQRFRRENKKILGEYQSAIGAETEKLLQEQYAEGGSDGFFHASDNKLRALIQEMQNNEARVERAALRYMNDVYRKTILRTATAMTAGGMTLHQATDEATKDFLAQGINCVEYANGRRVNIASYAEMALRACSTRAMLMGEAKQRERIGVDTVLVSQYGACSDTCLPWQGRVYIDDVFQDYYGDRRGSFGVSRNGRQYMLLSIAIKGGLFHPNCRHTISTWIEGVSRKPKPMNIREIECVNKLETQQRKLEREVRRAKREAAGLTDPEAVKAARAKVRETQAELRKFIQDNSDVLRRDYWRERNDGDDGAARPTKSSAAGPSPEPTDSTLKAARVTGIDVSKEYAKQATPGEGVITQDEGYDPNRHTDEIKIAEWLHSQYGGEIRLLNESRIEGEKRADLLWRDKLWDLKTSSTEISANAAIRKGLRQIRENPGGIILNFGANEFSLEKLKGVINERMQWYKKPEDIDIMIVSNGSVVEILRYKGKK